MKPRWVAWTVGILLIAMFALLPLRIALASSDLKRIGFTARQVAGTIWQGRIGDLQLRSQPLGTFDVQLNPAALLLGKISMEFDRLDDPQGVLNGRLIAGLSRGVEELNGRLDVGEMFSPLPVRALDFQDFTVRFRNGRCVEAAGRVMPVISAPVPGIDFAGLSGAVECDGERARVRMVGGGDQSVEFYVQATGAYRGWISVANVPPPVAGALGMAGFKPSPEGMTLWVKGQL